MANVAKVDRTNYAAYNAKGQLWSDTVNMESNDLQAFLEELKEDLVKNPKEGYFTVCEINPIGKVSLTATFTETL